MSDVDTRQGLRQMAEPFAALRERLAAAGFTVQDEEPGEVYMPHSRFEREYQRAASGAVRFVEPTSCIGQMRVLDKQGPNWTLRCDACEAEWTVRVPADRIVEYLLERCGVPELFSGKEFDKSHPEQAATLEVCREWVLRFKREPLPAVALWGAAGRGKSHLLALIVETLIKRYQVDAIYRSMVPLMNELRGAVAAGVFEGTYSRMLNVPVLAIDDLGAERMTPAVQEWLTGLVDHRYSKELPLLVATNIPPHVWAESFGDRAASRLRGICVPFKLAGPDRRVQRQESLSMAAGE